MQGLKTVPLKVEFKMAQQDHFVHDMGVV